MVTRDDPAAGAPHQGVARDAMPCARDAAERRDRIDPAGVIAESFRSVGIGASECRSIFLDWVLSTDMPSGGPAAAIAVLLARHGARHPDHPMTEVLRAGLQAAPRRARRLGRAARADLSRLT